MLRIRDMFLIEGVTNQEINVHVHLVTCKINIYALSFLRDLKISMFPPPFESQMNRQITSPLSTTLKYINT